jgi:hypothetical protein
MADRAARDSAKCQSSGAAFGSQAYKKCRALLEDKMRALKMMFRPTEAKFPYSAALSECFGVALRGKVIVGGYNI